MSNGLSEPLWTECPGLALARNVEQGWSLRVTEQSFVVTFRGISLDAWCTTASTADMKRRAVLARDALEALSRELAL